MNVDPNISNPIHEDGRIFTVNRDSQQQFVGESTCAAFGDRVLQCLDPQTVTTMPMHAERQYVHNATFSRQLSSVASCNFPDRIRANLLVRVAIRFIGHDYHFFLHQDFLQQLNRAYNSSKNQEHDSGWVCKLFVILALGEMYSTSLPAAKEARPSTVPGTDYFLTAVGLLQDVFEEPSISQIETLLLFVSSSTYFGNEHVVSNLTSSPSTQTHSDVSTLHTCTVGWLYAQAPPWDYIGGCRNRRYCQPWSESTASASGGPCTSLTGHHAQSLGSL